MNCRDAFYLAGRTATGERANGSFQYRRRRCAFPHTQAQKKAASGRGGMGGGGSFRMSFGKTRRAIHARRDPLESSNRQTDLQFSLRG
jgi:hypothetical protein